MEARLMVAAVMLYVFSACIILFGLVYLTRSRILPYHERFLGRTFEELKKKDPKMAALSVASLRVVGALALGMGIGFVLMIRYQLNRGDATAWWIFLVMSLVALVPTTAVSFSIGGVHSPPGWVLTISILVMAVAMALSF